MADASGTKRALQARAQRISRTATNDITRQLRRKAQVGAGFGKSGATAQGIQSRQTAGSPTYRHQVESTTPQGEWREKGTRAHTIRPRQANALAFYWPKVGRVVVRAHVNHPGNDPMPWFEPTVKEWPRALRNAASRIG